MASAVHLLQPYGLSGFTHLAREAQRSVDLNRLADTVIGQSRAVGLGHRDIAADRLNVEMALFLADWFGEAVLA